MSAAVCFEREPFDEVSEMLLVIDARIAVAREHAGDSNRAGDVARLIAALSDVRIELDDLLAWLPRFGQRSVTHACARASITLVCHWCSEVSGFVRELASDSHGKWVETQRRAADESCVYVRDYLSPAFDALDRACWADVPVRAAVLRLYGSVVDLNWQLGC